MKKLRHYVAILTSFTFAVGIGTLYSNCSRQRALVPQAEKDRFLKSNFLFAAEVSDGGSGFFWLDGDQIDGGSGSSDQNDSGAGNNGTGNQTDNGTGTNNQNDGGTGPGAPGTPGNQLDDGTYVDNQNQDDSGNVGVTIPPPGTPDGGGVAVNAPGFSQNGMPRTRVCMQSNGIAGFQFLRSDGQTYSNCRTCPIVDRVNGRCLEFVSLPPGSTNSGRSLNLNDQPNGFAMVEDQQGQGGWVSTPEGEFWVSDLSQWEAANRPPPRVDPLVIDVVGDNRQLAELRLTSQIDGIEFDLFGQRTLPKPHTKVQTSWIDNPTFMFLVLPNERGEVLGIDQMFGDNTRGPDGKYSLDGFQALAKYDGRDALGKRIVRPVDGVIDRGDAVYKRLRLWGDDNKDGVADPGELRTLNDMGVVGIDLKYDPNYYERDIYGNEAVFKSVVLFDDGHKGMVFDLWFSPIQNDNIRITSSALRGPASVK